MIEFGNRIRQRRIELKLTQNQVATVCGVNRTTIAYYEQGKREPTLSVLIGLSKVLKVTMNWLGGLETINCKTVYVPVYRLPRPGEPLEIEENIVGKEMVEEEKDIMFCCIARDNSMAGRRIFRGAKVGIKKHEKLSSGDVVLVDVPEQGLIMRRAIIDSKKNIICFHAEEATESDLFFKMEEEPQYRIIGKCAFVKYIIC